MTVHHHEATKAKAIKILNLIAQRRSDTLHQRDAIPKKNDAIIENLHLIFKIFITICAPFLRRRTYYDHMEI